ncbi:MAG: hypothetical protein HGB28_00055 [Oscillochloris sp.]|nr:hypothetical protein [Oscillochloris sp.]
MQIFAVGVHRPIQDVNLQIAEPQHRGEGHALVVGAPHHREHAGDQLLRRERHGEDIVHAVVKGRQLGLEIPPVGQRDGREALDGWRGITKLREDGPVGQIQIDDDQVRAPCVERGVISDV